MDPRTPQYRTEVVCTVTGWDPAVFRARRNRAGLFPSTKQDAKGYGWTLYSLVDLCVARAVAKLERMGFVPADAVALAEHLRFSFIFMAEGKDFAPIAVIRNGLPETGVPQTIQWVDGATRLADLAMDKSDLEIAAIVNCLEIFGAVVKILKDIGNPAVLSEGETLALVARTLADAIRPKDDPEEDV